MLTLRLSNEYSGIVRDAFSRAGHIAWSCDILPSESDYTERHFQGDIFKFLTMPGFEPETWDLLIAHPPCTHLSVSGARWFTEGKKPLYLRFEALAFVDRLMNLPIPRICIENPVSVISSHIRKPNQVVNPYNFGHREQKRTCFWLKNLPNLIHTDECYDEMMKLPKKQRERVHWLGSGKGKERSLFFPNIASAMANQWGNLLNNEQAYIEDIE